MKKIQKFDLARGGWVLTAVAVALHESDQDIHQELDTTQLIYPYAVATTTAGSSAVAITSFRPKA